MRNPRLGIPQKPPGTADTYDIASESHDIVVAFGRAFQYTVMLPAYHNIEPTRHKSALAAAKRVQQLGDYVGIRVFDRQGQECDLSEVLDGGMVRVLRQTDETGLQFCEGWQ